MQRDREMQDATGVLWIGSQDERQTPLNATMQWLTDMDNLLHEAKELAEAEGYSEIGSTCISNLPACLFQMLDAMVAVGERFKNEMDLFDKIFTQHHPGTKGTDKLSKLGDAARDLIGLMRAAGQLLSSFMEAVEDECNAMDRAAAALMAGNAIVHRLSNMVVRTPTRHRIVRDEQ
jgi:hypothetical protein